MRKVTHGQDRSSGNNLSAVSRMEIDACRWTISALLPTSAISRVEIDQSAHHHSKQQPLRSRGWRSTLRRSARTAGVARQQPQPLRSRGWRSTPICHARLCDLEDGDRHVVMMACNSLRGLADGDRPVARLQPQPRHNLYDLEDEGRRLAFPVLDSNLYGLEDGDRP